MPYKIFIFLMCLYQPLSASVFEWRLSKSGGDVQVYTRDQLATDIEELKGVVYVDATLKQVLTLITDAENTQDWVHNCGGAKLLARMGGNQAMVYTVIKTPWPLSDRDMVVNFTFQQDHNQSMHISMRGVPDYLPEHQDIVRIPRLAGEWLLEPQDDGPLKITYQLNLDPGGNTPSWLVNQFSTDSMHQTLINMRDALTGYARLIDIDA